MSKLANLKETCLLFLRLGATSFGGPAAHIAIMEKEVVGKKQWMNQQEFIDLVGATNLIPGPNSTEMAMNCGYRRAGLAGLWLAGFCFILPAFLITGILAWFYKQYGSLPVIGPMFYGIQPVVIAIILDAVFKFGKKALKNGQLGILGVVTCVAGLYDINKIILIFGAGLIGMIMLSGIKKSAISVFPFVLLQVPTILTTYSTGKLFFTFLKIGCVLFGSGYVLFAYLDGDLVQHFHWLTRQQLIDAVAVGQFTPGPVLTTATFIGYQISGTTGALAATIGIFLPSFIFVWVLTPLVPKIRKSKVASAFLDSVNIASVAIMLVVVIQMGQTTLTDWKTWLISVAAFAALYFMKKLNAVWLIAAGAAIGYGFYLIG